MASIFSWLSLCAPEAPSFTEAESLDPHLIRAVQSLPAIYREVVVLKVWSGLTFQQIGETLAIPLNTAASRYRYALEHLRHALTPVRAEAGESGSCGASPQARAAGWADGRDGSCRGY